MLHFRNCLFLRYLTKRTTTNNLFCSPLRLTHTIFGSSDDSSKIWQLQHFSGDKNELRRFIIDKIRISGPITVAEYMQMCVGSSMTGYYSKKERGDIFGEQGDFITSPEFTQMIGELLAIWTVHEVFKMGHRGPWQLIEMGPGSGSLMSDILKVLSRFRLLDGLSVHLLETSDRLMKKQSELLCDVEKIRDYIMPEDLTGICKQVLPSKYGPTIHWYDDLLQIPQQFSVTVAHEFFDALPVHKFRKTKHGWREIFVGLDEKQKDLTFALAPGVSLAQKLYFKDLDNNSSVEDVEISPYSTTLCHTLADRITQNGGAALIIDYGHTGEKGDTFRAFSNHQLTDPLSNPGQIDITTDVNFKYLLDGLNGKVCHFGPISQAEFLINLGLNLRFEQLLLKCANDDQKAYLRRCYELLTDPKEMGERFKVLAFFPKVLEEVYVNFPPSGFARLQ